MADSSNVVRTILAYEVQEASIARARTANQQLKDSVLQTVEAIKQTDLVTNGTGGGVAALNQRFADFNQRMVVAKAAATEQRGELERLKAATDDVAVSTDKLAEANQKTSNSFEKLRASEIKRVSAFGAGSSGGDETSGGSNLGSTLRKLGSQGRALPAMATPFGISTDQISNLVRMGGALTDLADKAGISTTKLLGAGAAAAVLGVALIALTNNAKAAKEAAQADLDARTRAIELINNGSKEEVQARINELAAKREANAIIAKDANDLVDNLRKNNIEQLGGGLALVTEINSVLGTGGSELAAAKENAEKANKALGETSTELDLLTQNSGLAAQGLDDIAQAANRIHILAADISNGAAADLEAYKLANDPNTTTKQLDSRIRDLQLEIAVTQNSALAAQSRAEALGVETAEGQAATAEMNKLNDQAARAQSSLAALSQSFVRTAVTANETAAINEEIRKKEIEVAKQYNDDKAKLDEDLANKQNKLYADLADKQLELSDKVKEDTQKALDQLTEKSDALKSKLDDTLAEDKSDADAKALDRQKKFLTKEAQADTEAKAKLLQIQKDSDEKAYDLGLSRDFAGLAQLRRDTANRLAASNQEANDNRAKRLVQYEQENADDEENFVKSRDKKIAQYQKQLDDLKDAEKKQEAAINDNYTKQNNKLTDKFNKEFGALSAGYAAELTALQATTQQRVAIAANGAAALLKTEDELWKQALQILKGNFGGVISTAIPTPANHGGNINGKAAPIAFKAGGGGLSAGDFAQVNEPTSSGRESFTRGDGSSIRFPGYGTFYAEAQGRVNRGGGDGTTLVLDMPITIEGVDADAIMSKVGRLADDRIAYAIERLNQRNP